MLLQYDMNLSDREMERNYQFDLEVKFALGLGFDERPFETPIFEGSGILDLVTINTK